MIVSAEYERGVAAMREAAAAACVSLATERVLSGHAPTCIHEAIGRGNCADCNDALACAERIRGLDAPHNDDHDCTPDYLDPETR